MKINGIVLRIENKFLYIKLSRDIEIKDLPDIILKKIKNKVKLAVEHGADVSYIRPEILSQLELQQKQETAPITPDTQGTGETPGTHGEGGSEPDF